MSLPPLTMFIAGEQCLRWPVPWDGCGHLHDRIPSLDEEGRPPYRRSSTARILAAGLSLLSSNFNHETEMSRGVSCSCLIRTKRGQFLRPKRSS